MNFTSINFDCKSCGASLRFSPITNKLVCEFCRTEELIEIDNNKIKEHSFSKALNLLEAFPSQILLKSIICNKCSANFTMDYYSVSSNCPYCETPAITKFVKNIKPESILPFEISQKEAKSLFKKWIKKLWFAPSKLKRIINKESKLKGYYLPHWTYDSDTYTQYHGQRGDIYYITVERIVMINGNKEKRNVQEARIKWSPVSGQLRNSFDDITIGASKSISYTILENLNPWNTNLLVPFNRKYLSGFESEEYTIGLENGFKFAKVKMKQVIEKKIYNKIGGDQQRIDSMSTKYSNTTYKNVLFPIWTAEFKWKNKIYNYAINGQNGKIIGERPYSWIKISSLIILITFIISSIFYFNNHPIILNKIKIILLFQ